MSGYLVRWEVCAEVTCGCLKSGYGPLISLKYGYSAAQLVILVWTLALDMVLILDPRDKIGSLGTMSISGRHAEKTRLDYGGVC